MKRFLVRYRCWVALAGAALALAAPASAWAAFIPNPGPQSSSVGLQGTIPAAPPAQGGTIATPGAGAVFTSTPITVSGLCPNGLLVKVFSNNIFVGSTECQSGSYSIQVDLFSGRNDLVTRVYDALDQAGPDSSVVTVTFNDAQFAQFGTRVSLTSNYAKRGANPGQQLVWPILLSGGTGPYAISIDWGDGKPADLFTEDFPGEFDAKHVYNAAGIYSVTVRATDKNGTTAFLQLVGVGNGQAKQAAATSPTNQPPTSSTRVVWWPAAVLLPLVIAAFWLGQRHELFAIRRHLEQASKDAEQN